MWIVTLSVAVAFACLASLGALLLAARTAAAVRALPDLLTCSTESRLRSLEDSMAEALEVTRDTANKLKMQRVRTANSHATSASSRSALPDPYKEPEKWREAVNRRLSAAKLGSDGLQLQKGEGNG